ncbi:hypothetical protein Mgra_00010256 [Meloidogyne graminicola]|uniref:Uncharacterized protein n=1 Tax=Meloidogyne graminicola TaxID=189291 RepID=A0A8S9ZCP0_9BILA|nr:hypothetical protein Mgra_00010256 [Meloidogyne graminicola]
MCLVKLFFIFVLFVYSIGIILSERNNVEDENTKFVKKISDIRRELASLPFKNVESFFGPKLLQKIESIESPYLLKDSSGKIKKNSEIRWPLINQLFLSIPQWRREDIIVIYCEKNKIKEENCFDKIFEEYDDESRDKSKLLELLIIDKKDALTERLYYTLKSYNNRKIDFDFIYDILFAQPIFVLKQIIDNYYKFYDKMLISDKQLQNFISKNYKKELKSSKLEIHLNFKKYLEEDKENIKIWELLIKRINYVYKNELINEEEYNQIFKQILSLCEDNNEINIQNLFENFEILLIKSGFASKSVDVFNENFLKNKCVKDILATNNKKLTIPDYIKQILTKTKLTGKGKYNENIFNRFKNYIDESKHEELLSLLLVHYGSNELFKIITLENGILFDEDKIEKYQLEVEEKNFEIKRINEELNKEKNKNLNRKLEIEKEINLFKLVNIKKKEEFEEWLGLKCKQLRIKLEIEENKEKVEENKKNKFNNELRKQKLSLLKNSFRKELEEKINISKEKGIKEIKKLKKKFKEIKDKFVNLETENEKLNHKLETFEKNEVKRRVKKQKTEEKKKEKIHAKNEKERKKEEDIKIRIKNEINLLNKKVNELINDEIKVELKIELIEKFIINTEENMINENSNYIDLINKMEEEKEKEIINLTFKEAKLGIAANENLDRKFELEKELSILRIDNDKLGLYSFFKFVLSKECKKARKEIEIEFERERNLNLLEYKVKLLKKSMLIYKSEWNIFCKDFEKFKNDFDKKYSENLIFKTNDLDIEWYYDKNRNSMKRRIEELNIFCSPFLKLNGIIDNIIWNVYKQKTDVKIEERNNYISNEFLAERLFYILKAKTTNFDFIYDILFAQPIFEVKQIIDNYYKFYDKILISDKQLQNFISKNYKNELKISKLEIHLNFKKYLEKDKENIKIWELLIKRINYVYKNELINEEEYNQITSKILSLCENVENNGSESFTSSISQNLEVYFRIFEFNNQHGTDFKNKFIEKCANRIFKENTEKNTLNNLLNYKIKIVPQYLERLIIITEMEDEDFYSEDISSYFIKFLENDQNEEMLTLLVVYHKSNLLELIEKTIEENKFNEKFQNLKNMLDEQKKL